VPPDYYDASIRTNLIQRFWHRRRFAAVAGLATRIEGKMLDVGCHGATLTRVVADEAQPKEVHALDISQQAIAYARSRFPHFHFYVADAANLPFKDASFDAVFCLEVLEHVADPEKVLLEIMRCLRPGGYAVILVPVENFLFRLLWFLWTNFSRGRVWRYAHIHNDRRDYIGGLPEKVGFHVVKNDWFLLGMLRVAKLTRR
jgi:ubiquinone/menaquinone biosynthesis C-methylase UbiE